MKNNDVIIIGGGLTGLIAAAAARAGTDKVLLVTKGVGSIAIGGGSIDVLGYGADGRPVPSAAVGLAALSGDHPYAKIGPAAVEQGLAFFRDLAAAAGYPYLGSLTERSLLITAAGTLKPTCLVPRSMDTSGLRAASDVAVIGFAAMKDYYPDIVLRGLRKHVGGDRDYRVVWLESGLAQGRDLTALDIARSLDREEGRSRLIHQLKAHLVPGTVAIMPPVLGTRPDCRLLDELEQTTGCRFIETVGLPPAVTGLRLRTLLLDHLRRHGVRIIEQADVTTAVTDAGRCMAVTTSGLDRERTYYARTFVLASGGFFGGGLQATVDAVREPLFGLPVHGAADREAWSQDDLLSPEGQPFARCGVAVDSRLRPLDDQGGVLLSNVYIAGRNLAGYDHCQEKSGNGVAVASGYLAGTLAGEVRA